MRAVRRAISRAILVAPLAALAFSARAQPPAASTLDTEWTASIVEEDDFWAPDNRDRHYTHGIRFSATTPDLAAPEWQRPFQWFAQNTPIFADNCVSFSCRYSFSGGQNIYTPEDGSRVNPNPRDRPYAGWLYGGIEMMQDEGGKAFEELALKLGIVGPASFASETQNKFHLLIDVAPFRGWHAQLRNEPALDLFYSKKWRFSDPKAPVTGWGWDVLPQASVRIGNVYDYAAAGGMVRFGRNLLVDYGPPHVDLNLGADYLNPKRATVGDFAIYGFFGMEGRAVAHNIFLDGNDFKPSAHVDKMPFVGDLEAGLAASWCHFRLAYAYVYRSEEFVHQNAPDHYGSLNLTFHLPL